MRDNVKQLIEHVCDGEFSEDAAYENLELMAGEYDWQKDLIKLLDRLNDDLAKPTNITIEVEGGCVTDVHDLPEGWTYTVDDKDLPDETAELLAELISIAQQRMGLPKPVETRIDEIDMDDETDRLDLLEEALSITEPYKDALEQDMRDCWLRISAEAANLRDPEDEESDD